MRSLRASVASLAPLASLFMLASSAGCSSSAAPGPITAEPVSSQGEELAMTRDRVVVVRPDARRCVAPLCGGYFVRELNRGEAERYVSALDLSATGLDDAAVAGALAAPTSLVLRGHLGAADARHGTRRFAARDVWRGMPGVAPADDEAFYTVAPRTPPIECLVAPCPEEIATLVNGRDHYAFDGVDVAPAALAWVDASWLASRVTEHGAVVAASWVRGTHYPGGYAWTLQTSQVYVHLPDRVGPCPAAPAQACDEGTVAAFERNPDRCLIQVACVKRAICPLYMPACSAGYTLGAWFGRSGCAQFACDPTFVTN